MKLQAPDNTTSASYAGVEYRVDEYGQINVPDAALDALSSHGFYVPGHKPAPQVVQVIQRALFNARGISFRDELTERQLRAIAAIVNLDLPEEVREAPDVIGPDGLVMLTASYLAKLDRAELLDIVKTRFGATDDPPPNFTDDQLRSAILEFSQRIAASTPQVAAEDLPADLTPEQQAEIAAEQAAEEANPAEPKWSSMNVGQLKQFAADNGLDVLDKIDATSDITTKRKIVRLAYAAKHATFKL
jgi:hypothetical protein